MLKKTWFALLAALALIVGSSTCSELDRHPTAAPAPVERILTPPANPEEPVGLVEIEGQGAMVTRIFKWPRCGKAVFSYVVEPGSDNRASEEAPARASFTLDLHAFQEEADRTLVSLDVPASEPVTGSAFWTLDGYDYFLSVTNTDAPWRVRVECQEDVPSVGRGIEIAGHGNYVSPNFDLPFCWKQVFTWSSEPDETGTAGMRMDLCGPSGWCKKMIDEFWTDVAEPVTNQTGGLKDGGTFFVAISETAGRDWTLSWECRSWYSYECLYGSCPSPQPAGTTP